MPDGRTLHWLFYGSGHLHKINIAHPQLSDKFNELKVSGVKISDAQASEIRKSVWNNAPTIAVPPDIHAEGQTWRYKTLLKRSEEHTSELQSPCNLVCRLLLEKKKRINA